MQDLVFWLLRIIATVVICYLLIRFFKFWKYARRINEIPGPKGLPFLGIAVEFLVPFEDLLNTVNNLLKKEQQAGHSLISVWFGPFAKLAIVKGSTCEAILKSSKYVNKSTEYNVAKKLMGGGILYSKKEIWEKRRKMIQPSFTVSVHKQFFPIFNKQTDICLELLKKLEDGGPFDVVPYLRCMSMDIVCETTLGTTANAQKNPLNDLVKAFHLVGDILCMRLFNPFMYSSFLYNLTKYKRQEVKCIETIHAFGRKLIRERKQFLEQRKLLQTNSDKEINENEIYGQKQRLTTLDLLIEGTCDGQKLNEDEILDEVVMQIGAGLETTADLMSFTLFLLGCNPEAQKKAQQELDSVLGDESDKHITYDDLMKLKYLDAVVKESNRLYPPLPIFARVMNEDVVIDGYTVPARTTVGIMLYTIHRDPKVFPDPEKFHPERFLDTNANRPSMYEYMPFSQGPRNCIAYRIGLLQGKVSVAQILRKYDIISHDKPENLKLAAAPVLRSYHGLRISLHRRKLL